MSKRRFVTWHDETLWGDNATNSGLVFGVYDTKLNRKCFDSEQGGIITSMDAAIKRVKEMNKGVKHNANLHST